MMFDCSPDLEACTYPDPVYALPATGGDWLLILLIAVVVVVVGMILVVAFDGRDK